MSGATKFGTATETGTDSFETGERAAERGRDDLGVEDVDFCQVFCSPQYDYEEVVRGIKSVTGGETELIGCSSAGEFTEKGVVEQSVTVALVSSGNLQFFTGFGTGLDEDIEACIQEAVSSLPWDVEGYPYKAAINLHDGLVGKGETIANLTKQKLGPHIPVAGGSAGDDLQLEATHVFRNHEVAQNAVAVALVASKEPIPMTVQHGHEPVSEPITVTEAEGNTIHELDGKPAFERWKKVVREPAMEQYGVDVDELDPDSEDFAKMLNRFELGAPIEAEEEEKLGLFDRIRRLWGDEPEPEYKIRWPGLTSTTDGPLEFAVDIEGDDELRVMHSGDQNQIESVRRAAREAVDQGDTGVAGGFVYDCICRAAILGDDFEQTVEAIDEELGAPFAGFETYGEICMNMSDMSGFHNTTSVVMLLPE